MIFQRTSFVQKETHKYYIIIIYYTMQYPSKERKYSINVLYHQSKIYFFLEGNHFQKCEIYCLPMRSVQFKYSTKSNELTKFQVLSQFFC
ncbi:hypothetical protein pb186bvf_001722 [Paramecium bursaria]